MSKARACAAGGSWVRPHHGPRSLHQAAPAAPHTPSLGSPALRVRNEANGPGRYRTASGLLPGSEFAAAAGARPSRSIGRSSRLNSDSVGVRVPGGLRSSGGVNSCPGPRVVSDTRRHPHLMVLSWNPPRGASANPTVTCATTARFSPAPRGPANVQAAGADGAPSTPAAAIKAAGHSTFPTHGGVMTHAIDTIEHIDEAIATAARSRADAAPERARLLSKIIDSLLDERHARAHGGAA